MRIERFWWFFLLNGEHGAVRINLTSNIGLAIGKSELLQSLPRFARYDFRQMMLNCMKIHVMMFHAVHFCDPFFLEEQPYVYNPSLKKKTTPQKYLPKVAVSQIPSL